MNTESKKISLSDPSEEQQQLIDQIGRGHNIFADCVAGSGKTTLILHLAKANPE